jgi:hypothetical protein
MELKVMLKDQAPHALPHGAFFRIDLKDRRALRQGSIALIHSAPTGDEDTLPGGANGSRECAPDDRLRAIRETFARRALPRIALRATK